MIYRLLFTLVLRHIDPERAHEMAKVTLQLAGKTPGRAVLRGLAGPVDARLRVQALGLTFPSPVGVAAGVDKDATWFEQLHALGFGFVEVGTVTALGQEGNERPRVARVTSRHALVNKMGFPNPGAEMVRGRLAARTGDAIIGANVGKSMRVPVERAEEDYRACVRALARVADYLVLNVSSPNTPGLRTLQAAEQLRPLIAGVRSELVAAKASIPIMIKVSPDLDDGQLDAISNLALELELDGIIAVNTTVDRELLGADGGAVPFDAGGVSGRPLREKALAVLGRLRANVGPRLVLVSVGGIEDADDVWERILAGATLVQVYTAFVYGGPAWPGRMNRELARRVRAAGAASIQDLVGSGAIPRSQEDPDDVTARA